ATPDLSPTSLPKRERTIFMAPFTTTSAIQPSLPTRMTTMPTIFHAPCSIAINLAGRLVVPSEQINSSFFCPSSRFGCAAARPILFSCPPRNCWLSVLRELRPSSKPIHCQRTCPRRTCNRDQYAHLFPLVIHKP